MSECAIKRVNEFVEVVAVLVSFVAPPYARKGRVVAHS